MRQKLTQTAAMIMVLLGCLFSGSSVFAQTRTIVGRVTSPDGNPIQGANIQEKGTQNVTASDAAGNYAIKLSSANSILVVSTVGFGTQELPVGKEGRVNMVLAPTNRQLDEVVVTALGIKKEARRIGYAVQTIKGSELTAAREPDVFNNLEGKVSGLTIGVSPELFSRPMIVNRGTKDMLIVVDGVPVNSDTWNINGDDVESMSVLKGPNAAALYGFRGQNGAIVITTKKGSRDAKGWQINLNTSNMLEKGFLIYPKDQTEYGRGTKFQYSFGEGLDDHTQRLPTWGPRADNQPVLQYNSPYDVTTGVRTPTPYKSIGANNYKNFLADGFLSSTNLSLSSSGTNSDVRMSYSHVYQKGTDPNTKVNMDVLNINTDYSINNRLKFEANINMDVQYTPNLPDANYGPNSYVYMFNVYGNSEYNVKDLANYYKAPMGIPGLRQYAENYGRSNNPYFMAQQWLRGHYKTDIYGYIKLDYNITKDLTAFVRTQFTGWSQERGEKVPAGTILNQYLPWYYWGWYGDYREDRRSLLENNTDFLISYNKDFTQGWHLNANLGASERSFRYSSFYGTTVDMAVPGVYSLSNSQTPSLAFNWTSNMQVYSGYYTADFGYKNYFNLSTTGRIDNLSTLPSGYNTFFYPSVALSSSLGDYLKLPSAITYLKLRASWAQVKGGQTTSQAPSAYALANGYFQGSGVTTGSLLGYGTESFTSYDGPTYNNQNQYTLTTYYNNLPSVAYSTTIANPKLKPFDVTSYEAGADIRLFHNRVGLDATYFITNNGPQEFGLGVPSSTTFGYENVNGIVTQKKGWELTLNATPVKSRDFSWDMTINWSTYVEKLKSIYGDLTEIQLGSNHLYHVGERVDDFYSTGFVTDGKGDIVNSGGGPLSSPGGIANNVYLGHLNPDFTFGFNNRIAYKSFSVSFQFDGRVGGKIYDDVWYHADNGGTAIETDKGAFKTARASEWESTNDGVAAIAPAYIAPGVMITGGTPTYANGQITNLKNIAFAPNNVPTTVQNYFSSSLGSNFDQYYMISRTFVKLREVQLAYAIPTKLLGKSGFKSATFALVGRNLLYFAKRKDFDIDQYASGTNVSNAGVAQYGTSGDVTLSSPSFRRFGFNLNVGF
jgi:TonB-linked SusC/RagA family outer membrane protein